MKFDKFILFPWGMYGMSGDQAKKLLQSIKECGFNASNFVPPSQFDICRELGLEIYCTLDEHNFMERELDHEKVMMNPETTEEELRQVMNQALENIPEDVRAIYLTDEPGTELFAPIRTMVDCVHEKTPWAEAYVNLYPNYAVCGAPNLSQLGADTYEEYLERFITEVKPDALSLDNYRVNISSNFEVKGGRENYFNNMIQARIACDAHNIPFEFIACCNQLRDWLTIPTFANLAFQGYTGLAAGARIFSWFLYYGRGRYLYSPIDNMSGEDVRTPTWYLLREVNRRILPLGTLLFDMQYRGMYFTNIEGLNNAKEVSELAAVKNFTSDEECCIGHYVDTDGRDNLLVVNCSMKRATKVDIDLGGELENYNIENQAWMKPLLANKEGKVSPLWLEPGCGLLLRKKD